MHKKTPGQGSMHSPAPARGPTSCSLGCNDTQKQGAAWPHTQPLNPGQMQWQEVPSDTMKAAGDLCGMRRRPTADGGKHEKGGAMHVGQPLRM